MVMRYRLSACGFTARPSPTSVTMPVNMSGLGKRIECVGPERLAAACLHLPGQAIERHAFERRDASIADHPGAAQQRHFVYQSRGSYAARELRAAFHHYAGDALLGENLEHFLKIELPIVIVDPEDLAALLLQDFLADGRLEVNTQVGVSRTVATTEVISGSFNVASSTTRTGERSNIPGSRQVSCGLSERTVPMATMMASLEARICQTRTRATSPVIGAGLRPASPALPSADTAILSIT